MAGTFGRKGLQPGQVAVARPSAPDSAVDDDMARRREAFLAAERARRAQEPAEHCYKTDYPGTAMPDYRPRRRSKSLGMAYLLWFFACGFSAHRFYLGAYRSAATQLGLSFGGIFLLAIAKPINIEPLMLLGLISMVCAWLWMLADAFLLPGLHRRNGREPQVDARAVFG